MPIKSNLMPIGRNWMPIKCTPGMPIRNTMMPIGNTLAHTESPDSLGGGNSWWTLGCNPIPTHSFTHWKLTLKHRWTWTERIYFSQHLLHVWHIERPTTLTSYDKWLTSFCKFQGHRPLYTRGKILCWKKSVYAIHFHYQQRENNYRWIEITCLLTGKPHAD